MKTIQKRASRAFSLIEVALALAITGMAVVSIFSLMSAALTTAQSARDDNTAGTLINQILADRRSSPYNAPSSLYGIPPLTVRSNYAPVAYFSKSGIPVPGYAPPTSPTDIPTMDCYYCVRVAITNVVGVATTTNAFGVVNPLLAAQFRIRVQYPAWPTNSPRLTNTCSTIIVRGKP